MAVWNESWESSEEPFPAGAPSTTAFRMQSARRAATSYRPARGESWRIFEEAVADGLEFAFGQRVKRMGGVQRFKPLPDMLALAPDGLLMLVDAKAAANGLYQLERPKLRAPVSTSSGNAPVRPGRCHWVSR